MPSSPGTEQTSRAFRNVLHLLTRQQWPPSSFWRCGQGGRLDQLIIPRLAGVGLGRERQRSFIDTYKADAPDAGIYSRVLRSLCGTLSEEEVEFVIVPLRAVRDELSMYK